MHSGNAWQPRLKVCWPVLLWGQLKISIGKWCVDSYCVRPGVLKIVSNAHPAERSSPSSCSKFLIWVQCVFGLRWIVALSAGFVCNFYISVHTDSKLPFTLPQCEFGLSRNWFKHWPNAWIQTLVSLFRLHIQPFQNDGHLKNDHGSNFSSERRCAHISNVCLHATEQ